MDALLYFLMWTWLLIVVVRFDRHARMGKEGRPPEFLSMSSSRMLKWVAPAEDRDPVCGSIVDTRRAKPTVHDGDVYYFCSRECREVFEAAPALHVAGAVKGPSETQRQLPT